MRNRIWIILALCLPALPALAAEPVAGQKTPIAQTTYSYEAAPASRSPAAALTQAVPGATGARRREANENINFTQGLTAQRQGNTTWFSTGVVCHGSEDVAVCN